MKRREQLAALMAFLVGAPLVAVFASAFMDGETRRAETVFRSVLGNDRFESLMAGEGGFPTTWAATAWRRTSSSPTGMGSRGASQDHRGKVVVLNFWSITCPPCLEELPSLEHLGHLAQQWGDVEVVAVSADEGWSAVTSVVPEDTRLTHVFDPTREVISGQFGTRLFPETWIIDREGRVRFRYDGALDWGNPIVVELVEAYR
jgi:thiol-disulfide isomerase/thioredoxin